MVLHVFAARHPIFADGLVLVWGSRGLVQLPGLKKGFGADLDMEFTSAGLHQTMKMTFNQPSSVFLDPACPLSPFRGGFNLEIPELVDGFPPATIPSTILNPLAQVTQEGEKKTMMEEDETRLELGGNICIHRGTTIGESAARYEKQATLAHLVTDLIAADVSVVRVEITRPIFASFLISVLCTGRLVSRCLRNRQPTVYAGMARVTKRSLTLLIHGSGEDGYM
ncbi:uncharacterized protein CLUP02_02109 [Colletotrichum lupini]|uniref:Uncharacterized protein n=1 Tax=Colletotrichum lupini TaxID=145971 RepID=A0A9Q8WAI5_9PEZI|nr:uncharacterized protein CLUP02_02109 [Colletotrichum lupini]UQC75455.1 hypothetical protein CLUP02_02109 [Colletotrichum lupini]